MEKKFEVCIICNTFNHSAYIKDALMGFAIQKTTFPFVCVVVDDSSTDGNQEVIKNFLDTHCDVDSCSEREESEDYSLTLVKHKDNANCFYAVFLLKYNHYNRPELNLRRRGYYARFFNAAKYSAYCEGDDYWIHPEFLQAAVNFLNINSDYSSVFGNKIVCDKVGNLISKVTFPNGIIVEDIMRGKNMGLRNLIFRKEIRDVEPFAGKGRDLYIYYQCAVSGKMKYIDEDFAVYRLTGNGVYSKLDKKNVIRTSYEHYYNFHKAVNFKYQKQYVECQMRNLLGCLFNIPMLIYCLKLTRLYHVPSLKRYMWYLSSVGCLVMRKIIA